MTLEEWAVRWRIPPQAFAELADCSIVTPGPDVSGSHKTEAYVMSAVRLEAPRRGVYLWRNNVGAGANVQLKELCDVCRDKARRPIRWGLGNDSKQVNEVFKSGDLIGGRPLLIQPHHVGYRVMQFVSRECKREDWVYTGTKEENAQLAWATLVNSLGGDAKIVNAVGSL